MENWNKHLLDIEKGIKSVDDVIEKMTVQQMRHVKKAHALKIAFLAGDILVVLPRIPLSLLKICVRFGYTYMAKFEKTSSVSKEDMMDLVSNLKYFGKNCMALDIFANQGNFSLQIWFV